VDRLAKVIETQMDVTKANTQAFVEINGKLESLQGAIDGLNAELNNGGFTRLEHRLCEVVRDGDAQVIAGMQSGLKESSAAISASILTGFSTNGLHIPKIGWVAITLFFLVMLVALGVKIPDVVAFFRGV
jgi:hypothetical protein